MSDDYSDPVGESEMRRRAAWLLAMLALVAALLVTLMLVFLGHDKKGTQAGPTGVNTYPTGPPTTHHATSPAGPTRSSASTSPTRSTGVSQPPHNTDKHVTCPSTSPCVATGDVGNLVAAINSYRQQHGAKPVDGSVSTAAQNCAVSNGGNCTGHWAESEVPKANGPEAASKISDRIDLADPSFTAIQVGWAWDPSAQTFYFAVIGVD